VKFVARNAGDIVAARRGGTPLACRLAFPVRRGAARVDGVDCRGGHGCVPGLSCPPARRQVSQGCYRVADLAYASGTGHARVRLGARLRLDCEFCSSLQLWVLAGCTLVHACVHRRVWSCAVRVRVHCAATLAVHPIKVIEQDDRYFERGLLIVKVHVML